jgi:hypothetical protein
LKRAPLIFNDEALNSPKLIDFALTEDKFGLSQQGKILSYLVNNKHEALAVKAVDAFAVQIARIKESDHLKKETVGSVRLYLKLHAPENELRAKIESLLDKKMNAFWPKHETSLSI